MPNRQPPHRQPWWLRVQAMAVSSREAVSFRWHCEARGSLQNSHIHIEHRIQGTKSSYRPLGSSRRYERTCQKDAGNTEERPHLHAHHVGVCSTRRRSNLSADLLFSFFLLCRPQITSHSLSNDELVQGCCICRTHPGAPRGTVNNASAAASTKLENLQHRRWRQWGAARAAAVSTSARVPAGLHRPVYTVRGVCGLDRRGEERVAARGGAGGAARVLPSVPGPPEAPTRDAA